MGNQNQSALFCQCLFLKHIVNGHIKTTDKKERMSKQDTYRNWSLNLVKNTKEIEQATDCVSKSGNFTNLGEQDI